MCYNSINSVGNEEPVRVCAAVQQKEPEEQEAGEGEKSTTQLERQLSAGSAQCSISPFILISHEPSHPPQLHSALTCHHVGEERETLHLITERSLLEPEMSCWHTCEKAFWHAECDVACLWSDPNDP